MKQPYVNSYVRGLTSLSKFEITAIYSINDYVIVTTKMESLDKAKSHRKYMELFGWGLDADRSNDREQRWIYNAITPPFNVDYSIEKFNTINLSMEQTTEV